MMSNVLADFRYGLRMLIRTPLLSITGALTIALGVALTTHTFSAVYGSLARAPSVDPDGNLMVLRQTRLDRGIRSTSMPYADLRILEEQQSSFESLEGYFHSVANLADETLPPQRVNSAVGTAGLLDMAGVEPLLGRVFQAGEDGSDAPRLVVIGFDVWQSRFGGDPGVLGRSVRVNGEPHEIIGVMPRGFHFPFDQSLWLTHRIDVESLDPSDRSFRNEVVGRLKAGVTRASATAELSAITGRIVERFPDSHEGVGIDVMTFVERYMPPQITNVLGLMMAAVLGVLLIACANVANLLLARSTVRSREVAVRRALGASRLRVIRQLLTESVVLALVGGALGLGLAWVGIDWFNAAIMDIQKPYWIDVRIDGAALAFTLLITVGSAVIAGTVPAFRASGDGISPILRDQARGSSSLRMGRFSSGLVVAELAVSCALLVGAGLLVKSVVNLNRTDKGFDTESIFTATLVLSQSDYPEFQDRERFWLELQRRLRDEPGVESVTLASRPPGSGAFTLAFGVEGESYEQESDYPVSWALWAGADYFETFGIPVLQGRGFTEADMRADSEPVAVVSESFARRFPDGVALDRRIRLGRSLDSEVPWLRVVGVVGDVFTGSGDVGGLGSGDVTEELLYVGFSYFEPSGASLAAKTSMRPEELAPRARALVAGLDPNLPLEDVLTFEAALARTNWAFGLFGTLFAAFGLAALFLAAVGLYGVVAFSVARRKQEIGVRMALGADGGRILGMVLRKAVVQIVAGVGIGLLLGAGLARPLQVALLDVDPGDPLVYTLIVVTLVGAGTLASLVPALRAIRVDPSMALHAE